MGFRGAAPSGMGPQGAAQGFRGAAPSGMGPQGALKKAMSKLKIYFCTFSPTKGAHPCTSSSEQGGCKRVLEAFF